MNGPPTRPPTAGGGPAGPFGYARSDDLRVLGLPDGLVRIWRAVLLESLAQRLTRDRSLRLYLETCLECGACAQACPQYAATGDPGEIPAARAGLMRRVHHLLFTATGRWGRRLIPRQVFSPELLNRWFYYFNRCLLCRRCAIFCPQGLDTAHVAQVAREIMAAAGLTARCGAEAAAGVMRGGNVLSISADSWAEAASTIEAELYAETGIAVRVPVDARGSDVLLLAPVGDMFIHTDSIKGCAKMFHVAGIHWTTTTMVAPDDHAFHLGSGPRREFARRLHMAVDGLKPQRVAWGESGGGWRLAGQLWREAEHPLAGPPGHIVELAWELLNQQPLSRRIDPRANQDLVVTYHDPCQVARAANLLEAPRRLLAVLAPVFREMPPETTGLYTWCCGGGGAQPLDREENLIGGRRRAEALASTGANYLATICAVCKSALPVALGKHLSREVTVGGVMDLMGRALTPYLTGLTQTATGGPR